jgi:hypothetical protein
MMKQALWAGGVCGLLSVSCSNGPGSADAGGPGGGSTGGATLAGTWDLTTTATGSNVTTVTVGQDSLTITSPSFSLTATRTRNALTFTDHPSPGNPNDSATLAATQTAAPFSAGIVPFDLGGSWTMQIANAGGTPFMTCTATLSATEIDGSCQKITSDGFDFSFTTTRMASAASSFRDFGGAWINTWTWPGTSGGNFPCRLDFTGNDITTCAGGAMNGAVTGSPLSGISFTYDGANMASGVAQGWAEFSATRR